MLGSWRFHLEATPHSSLQKTLMRGECHLSTIGNFSLEKPPLSGKWVAIFSGLWQQSGFPIFQTPSFLCSLNLPIEEDPLWRNLGLPIPSTYADSNINKHQLPFGVRSQRMELQSTKEHSKILVWDPHPYGKTLMGCVSRCQRGWLHNNPMCAWAKV